MQQCGIPEDPQRKPELYPQQNNLASYHQAAPQYQTPAVATSYGAVGTNDVYQASGARKELEGQRETVSVLPNMKNLVAPQMTAYAPYSGYSTSASNSAASSASSSYSGGSSASLGYQTALA